jgi:hypothetical protein
MGVLRRVYVGEIDGRFCSHCGGPVEQSAEGGRLARRPPCASDIRAYLSAREPFDDRFIPSYRGTVTLGRLLEGWPTELVLLTLRRS